VRALRVTDEAFPAIDDDATVRRALRAVREKYPHTALAFANGGDRSSAARIAEAGACEELGIELRFGVGGEEKADSSTRIIAALGEDQ
jgi:glycerol-3-phosphate cytidylyltransferase/D-beta-D-heptose 7-phosphate kinase/D-beta-D-heptose 1-phosphate adenosyltransferase